MVSIRLFKFYTMIQANELRIGNYLHDPKTGSWLKVIQIDIDGNISTYVMDRTKFPLPDGWSTSPIPLTPEILENCGFEKLPHYFSVERFHITKQDNSDYWWTAFNKNNAHINKIKYLHQLQNLYFALTGQELTINL